MVTSEVFDRLKELQGILRSRYELERKIEIAPNELVVQEGNLAKSKAEYDSKNKSYEEAKANVDATKSEIATAVATREDGEKKMDTVTSHRDYELLFKQIEDASAKETQLRKTLEFQERELAKATEEVSKAKDFVDSQEPDFLKARDSINQEIADSRAKIAELDKEEASLTPDMDAEILFKFERIIQRNDEGIVAVRNGVCMGCHMILPAQFANEVREGEHINFCPYCSRILYYEQADNDGESTFFGEMGSLLDLDDEDEEISDEDEIEPDSDADELDEDEKELSPIDSDEESVNPLSDDMVE